jgi:hypothetical protein
VRADACLHGDHTHRVGDDIVQLLRDVQTLVGDRAPGFLVAFALECDRALFELAGVEPPIANRRPEQVRGRENGEVRHEPRGVEVGRHHARDHERDRDPPRAGGPGPPRRVRAERVRAETERL